MFLTNVSLNADVNSHSDSTSKGSTVIPPERNADEELETYRQRFVGEVDLPERAPHPSLHSPFPIH